MSPPDYPQHAYDTEDNLLSITDANNHTTSFAYNAPGWVTGTTFPSTLSESYTRDLMGNLLSKTDCKGYTIQYVYDALCRLIQKTYPDTTNVEYAYDLAGKVQQVVDPSGTYGFAYDNMGRLIGTSTQYSYLPGVNFQSAYTYDAASNRRSLTVASAPIRLGDVECDARPVAFVDMEQRLERSEKTTSDCPGTARMAIAAHRARDRGASGDRRSVPESGPGSE